MTCSSSDLVGNCICGLGFLQVVQPRCCSAGVGVVTKSEDPHQVQIVLGGVVDG